MDAGSIAGMFAGEMVTHQRKLAGKAGEAQTAQAALESAAKAVLEQQEAQRKAAGSLLSTWDSAASAGFESKSAKFGKDLGTTAEASAQAAKIVSEVTDALAARHGATGQLVDEFVTKASKLLGAVLAVAGIAMPGALLKAVADVSDLAGRYIKESAGHLKDAREEMEEAARKLRALQKEIDHDGIDDPGTGKHKPDGKGKAKNDGKGKGTDQGKADDKGKSSKKPSGKADEILDHARANLGYHEGANNKNKWGPTGQPWCSYFATSMWRESGVDIPKYGFTGDVYKWGERNGTAYNRGSLAEQARPGDAILFGTGPTWAGSEHIGIIEKVDGNKITTIEGNSSDQVMRHTYTLPRDAHKFYGGVHPK